jgi:Cu2+-exporting ATPase
VIEAGANAVTGRIVVQWDPRRVALSVLMARLEALGYRPWLATGDAREQARRREQRQWLLRLGVAGLGAMQAMMFAEALYLDTASQMALPTRDFFRWVTFLVSTPVVFYSGWPFLHGMWRELRGARLGMDTLIAGSTLLAYFASVAETVRGGPHVWYDAAVMFVLLLLAARMLEQRTRTIASAQVDALAQARPALAVRETGASTTEQVPLAKLAIGDVLRVAAGEVVPADGELLDRDAAFDEALISGESAAVMRVAGDTALAGSIACRQPARLRVTALGADTRLSQITRLVEQAQGERPRLARLADRVAGWFVFALLLCALAVYAWWRQHDPARAFEVTLALLVISCPCALSLAIPTALATAHGALARIGVLGLRPDALATLARVDRVVMDKTGTLTRTGVDLAGVETFAGISRAQAVRLAAALERDSRHPLAHAFASAHDPLVVVRDVRNIDGAGVEGSIDGATWRIGRAEFAAARVDDGALWLGDGTCAVARFPVVEQIRDEAAEAVASLHALGLKLELCSGDGQARAAAVADSLGLDRACGRQLPEDKLQRVRELQQAGHVVAMVGDGINDAPVLAGADVSIAMGEGAALAQRAADLVLTAPSLLRIPQAVALARRTRRIVAQNLGWAIAYNVVALPLAASGQVTPWLAALGMASSSLMVTLNALRLARKEA